MLHAVPRHAPRADLASIRHELAERHHVLVVDAIDLVLAELAVLTLAALLPALVVLVATPLRAALLRPSPTRHREETPPARFRRRPVRRPSRPSLRSSTPRRNVPDASPMRSP